MLNKHSQYMTLAIEEAWKYQLLTYPNPAVGASVVRNNQILSVESHREAGFPHAEVLALQSAYLTQYPNSSLKNMTKSQDIHNFLSINHKDFFIDCEIYVTLEPCNHKGKTPACAILLESIKIKKIYIGTMDPNNQASGGYGRLINAAIEVEVDVNKKETDKLLYPFLKYQGGHFNFFKMAAREDGTISAGYITTQDSLNLVHEIRTKLDLMVIGGNTVRIDRPTLDSRFARINKSSNILIYSRKKKFDETIPLFSIKKRKVTISSSLDLLEKKSFVMFEGGYRLLSNVKNKIDYIMLFISHKIQSINKKSLEIEGFTIEYSYYLNKYDEVIYLKKDNTK